MERHRPTIDAGILYENNFFMDIQNGDQKLVAICPFCYQENCDCIKKPGLKKTALQNIQDAYRKVARQKNPDEIEREDVMDWVLANVQATGFPHLISPENAHPCLYFIKFVLENTHGEYLEVYAFGDEFSEKEKKGGDWITGILQLKRRKLENLWIYYFQVEKVEGIHSDADLLIKHGDNIKNLRADMPIEHLYVPHPQGQGGKIGLLNITIGFAKWIPEAKVEAKTEAKKTKLAPAPISKLFNPIRIPSALLPNQQKLEGIQ